jgi:hypothetical protein
MQYNSQRPDLIIPEYGRNIQNMIEYCVSVEDREERNKVALAIISVMGQLFPYLRDIDDYKHKLWDHLHIMSKFKLDVDSPYPVPAPESLLEKPDRVAYPTGNIKWGHYGKTLEQFIEKAKEYPEGDEKDTLTHIIANLMKRQYLTWNRDSVEDDLIITQLTSISGGKLKLKEGAELVPTSAVLQDQKSKKPQHNKGTRKKRR